MAITSPDNIRTPDPGDPYNLVPDLQTLAQDVQDALIARGNVFRGTAAQRVAFLSTASPGMLWQDTDGIGMLWKRGASQWVPAVWRWSGTTAQMNAFTQAPNGFEWFNTSDNSGYVRLGGAWRKDPPVFTATLTPVVSGGGVTSGWHYAGSSTYNFPAGTFTTTPVVTLFGHGTGFITTSLTSKTATGFTYAVMRLGAAPASDTRVELQAWVP